MATVATGYAAALRETSILGGLFAVSVGRRGATEPSARAELPLCLPTRLLSSISFCEIDYKRPGEKKENLLVAVAPLKDHISPVLATIPSRLYGLFCSLSPPVLYSLRNSNSASNACRTMDGTLQPPP